MAAPKWRPLLGDALARRVAKLTDDPAEFCRAAVERAATAAEAQRTTVAERNACKHPEKDRQYGRCRACGTKGLPNVARERSP